MFNITIYSDDFTKKTNDCDLSTLTNGTYFFYDNQEITEWNKELYSLKYGKRMFSLCYELSRFEIDLPNLIDGTAMFYGSGGLKKFNSNLDNLLCGSNMFYQTWIDTLNTSLTCLENGYQMFYNNNLVDFKNPLPNLSNGHYMFSNNLSLTYFASDMPKLIYGLYMFKGCPLNQFRGILSKLITGHMMFSNCALDATSLLVILNTINDVKSLKEKYTNGNIPFVEVDSTTSTFSNSEGFTADYNYVYTYANPHPYTFEINAPYVGRITIGLYCSSSNVASFLNEIGYNSLEEIESEFAEKGWIVDWQFNGPSTLNIDDDDIQTVWVKLEETENSDVAEYKSKDDSKLYTLNWFHRTSDDSVEGYIEFNSLDDALTYFDVIPL